MEGLRVMPPVPFTVRRSNKTDYVQGVLVPKGTLMHICVRHHFGAEFSVSSHSLRLHKSIPGQLYGVKTLKRMFCILTQHQAY